MVIGILQRPWVRLKVFFCQMIPYYVRLLLVWVKVLIHRRDFKKKSYFDNVWGTSVFFFHPVLIIQSELLMIFFWWLLWTKTPRISVRTLFKTFLVIYKKNSGLFYYVLLDIKRSKKILNFIKVQFFTLKTCSHQWNENDFS